MGIEIDLMENYPRTKRNLDERLQEKTEQEEEGEGEEEMAEEVYVSARKITPPR